jgi:ABC-type polysaccharide/polyol phosphate export permease
LEEDIKANMLEPLFLARWPVHLLLLARSLAHSISSLCLSFLLLALLAWIAGAELHVGLRALAALLLLNLTLSGLGLFMAGLVIVYKRVSLLTSISYLACGTAVAAAIAPRPDDTRVPYPVLSAVELFSRSVFGGDIPAALWLSAVAWSVLLLAAGTYALHRYAQCARHDGSLAHG